ncbi:MAG: 2-C-methyl-D-erythritol 4-phosphate cytidylyltransferase [Paludibacteraceae bacterium]|nr:2-C-methyl-D-erythritol 4-phosphate cytidylyltransferase [Paludibacteraceae bacterium]MBO7233658.1 2-C-methyl-D-erythritol 4-phosphate cytidylyltransferase [Paludibacteraceae bacterium]MBO7259499.1 2-C-methyl-D-erythritol 4-phosphate cytidylyltransferase [Paludibacteraceae bacterium]
MKRATIIVAGGSGQRMGSALPKQFMAVGGKPVLLRTIETFYTFDPQMILVVVLPATQIDVWNELLIHHQSSIPHVVAEGGATRFESVKNGINALPEDVELIGVHDGVRPFVSMDTLARCYSNAKPAIVPVIPMYDSLRQLTEMGNNSVDRSSYVAVQTPQVFSASLLRQAYSQPYNVLYTDDASVVEALGECIELTEGNRENIKLTTPFDLIIAEGIISGMPL